MRQDLQCLVIQTPSWFVRLCPRRRPLLPAVIDLLAMVISSSVSESASQGRSSNLLTA